MSDFVIFLLAVFVIGLMTMFISAHLGIAGDRNRAREQKHAIQKVAAQAVDRTIENHLNTLVKKAKQTIYLDDYGNTITRDWDKEMEYFVTNVLMEEIEIATQKYAASERIKGPLQFTITPDAIEDAINSRVLPRIKDDYAQQGSKDVSGSDFEHLCADLLRKSGWNARATKASGDQGVDVIADRDGVRVVLQCKRYTSPVGNKAVQEAFSGKQFEDADYAAVVSNADYTKSARQLANKNGVLLLHYDDLPRLWEKIRHGLA